MRIIISPAKKMNVDGDSPVVPQEPVFLERAKEVVATLQAMEPEALQTLWKCNDQLAQLNVERLATMCLDGGQTPAIFSYEGIQYRYMAPHVLEGQQLNYLQTHLRIVSGLYGLVRPFDGVTPYRLEMQAKLSVGNHKHLYSYWGDSLAKELMGETDCIINLASSEYSKAILPHLSASVRCITCTFGQRKGDAIVEKGTMCKMARGQMVRFLAENAITNPDDITQFNQLDYHFSPIDSTDTQFVFIKGA